MPLTPATHEGKKIQFAHPSEEEFSRILDFYKIEWNYEPRTFLLNWDGEGNVTEAFTPDFYLPQQDLYVEITTLRQELVTKKNQKLRRLRELYPDIQIKLFYRRDFRRLLDKYGLSGEQHGLIGQEALK
jgi:bifunctional protein TilS/HprT